MRNPWGNMPAERAASINRDAVGVHPDVQYYWSEKHS